MFGRRERIELKTESEIAAMRAAGEVVAQALAAVQAAAAPGVTTGELDEIAHEVMRQHNATPAFLGYSFPGVPPFPGVICSSVNDEVVHGIPGARVLVEGDLLSVDCGAELDGWFGDAAVSIPIGTVSEPVAQLSAATQAALWAGIRAAVVGARLSDISHAIEQSIVASGQRDGRTYGILREFVGHGIGSQMHMEPDVPNFGEPGRGPKLKAGMTFAIEPMVTLGTDDVAVLDDEWTVVTIDDSWAAHWEHTVAVTATGPVVLTKE